MASAVDMAPEQAEAVVANVPSTPRTLRAVHSYAETPEVGAAAVAQTPDGSAVAQTPDGSAKRRKLVRQNSAPMAPVEQRRRVKEKTPAELAGSEAQVKFNDAIAESKVEEGYVGAMIADQVLRTSKNFTRAKRLIAWYRTRAEANVGTLFGRKVAVEDVAVAEKRVHEVWTARLARARRPTVGNVQLVMQKTAERCDDIQDAQELLSKLKPEVGRVTRKGRVLLEGEIEEAQGRCEKLFDRLSKCEDASEKPSSRRAGGAPRKGRRLLKRQSSALSDLSSSGEEEKPAARKEKRAACDASSGKAAGGEDDADDSKTEVMSQKSEGDRDAASDDGVLSDSDDDLSSEEEVDKEEAEAVDEKDLMAAEEEVHVAPVPPAWAGAPALGTEGFNAFAVEAMRKTGIGSSPLQARLDPKVPCPKLQPHQEVVPFMLQPGSPVSRLLVDHPTGSGKTREMIEVLNGFFSDPRPKVPIFPKEAVCRNFYAELLRWPSLYRDYFCCLRPGSASCAAGARDWRTRRGHQWDLSTLSEEDVRQLCGDLKEVLEMKGCFYMGRMRRTWRDGFRKKFPDEKLPAAPLRALRYTSAGGSHTAVREADGLPASALFKIGFSKDDPNVYSNKVVIMDEVHNLVRTQTMYGDQLANLRELLLGAKNIVLAGFTGTPILSEPGEGRRLLDVVKGRNAPEGDDGFLSSFPIRPRPLFPHSLPAGVPDAVLTPSLRKQFVRKVALFGEPLQRYDEKRALGLSQRRLRRYCSLCVHFGSFHEGKFGSKARVLRSFNACAPKLWAIAEDIASDTSKALVLVERHSGMGALLAHLKELAARSEQPFGVATMDELAEFNASSNLRGERYRVLVADASQCSEGVSFFAVRRVLLADVPATPSALVQQVGRSIRMYGHAGLPDEEQSVVATLYAAAFPSWLREPLGAWAYRAQPKATTKSSSASLPAKGATTDATAAAPAGEQGVDAAKQERKAKRLLRTLMRVGITSLAVLKKRLDDYCASHNLTPVPLVPSAPATEGNESAEKPEVEAAAPTSVAKEFKTDDAIGFLESIGLWYYARMLRESQNNNLRRRRTTKGPGVAAPPASSGASGADPSAAALARAAGKLPPHYLVRALDGLRLAPSAPDAVESMRLSSLTADEEALRDLAAKGREFVPALADFRGRAVDVELFRPFLGETRAPEAATAADEEEDTTYEFNVSDGESNDEGNGASKAPPLVLPPTWRTERVNVNGRLVREFVDARGTRYRTEAQALRKVDEERRKENMKRLMAEKFANRFSAQKAAAAAQAEQQPAEQQAAEEPEAKRPRTDEPEPEAKASEEAAPEAKVAEEVPATTAAVADEN